MVLRDLKPENVGFDRSDGRPVLFDLGYAREERACAAREERAYLDAASAALAWRASHSRYGGDDSDEGPMGDGLDDRSSGSLSD